MTRADRTRMLALVSLLLAAAIAVNLAHVAQLGGAW
jgi:hypothetical protein